MPPADANDQAGHVPWPQRLGVFGGTFDPVHIGHLVVAEEALAVLHLDAVLFVPAGAPPHKPDSPITAPEHRLRMLEVALDMSPRFEVNRADLDRPGPHYTIETLQIMRGRWPAAELFLVLGADALRDLPTWRAPQAITNAATLVVADRPLVNLDLGPLGAAMPGIAERTVFIHPPLIGVSASDIRQRVRDGRPIRHQVPPGVEAYIRRAGLYSR